MTDLELRAIEKRWRNLRTEAVGGIAKQACVDVQSLIDELRRRDKAHRQAADQEAAITGALLGEPLPTKLNVAPLLAGQDIRLAAEGHWIALHGDMAEIERVLAGYADQEGLHFRRGDGVGFVGYADYERRLLAHLALNDLWDYLVANLPNSIRISGWHNASHMTMSGQFKEVSE